MSVPVGRVEVEVVLLAMATFLELVGEEVVDDGDVTESSL